jgi:hypothetical protein
MVHTSHSRNEESVYSAVAGCLDEQAPRRVRENEKRA